jgi:CheY-like chemotaxis protein
MIENNLSTKPTIIGQSDFVKCSGNGEVIMVVDDHSLNRSTTKRILELAGYTVVALSSGEEAVALSEDFDDFRLILMDLRMPGMDGFMTAKALRTNTQFTTPIVALSAEVGEGITDRCQQAGMNGYIPKPIDYSQLLAAVTQYARCSECTEPSCEKSLVYLKKRPIIEGNVDHRTN